MTHFTHDYEQGIKDERERIVQLIRDTCAKPEIDEDGSFIYSEDLVELILHGKIE